jgi:hypothetical protein
MIPTNSSGTTNGCDNISSNCVVWQGPDITCIDLCTGDTITDVTYKLATKVCKLITDGVTANPSLAGLDLTCLKIPGITPTDLIPVLQAMVVQICANTGTGQVPNSSSSLSARSQVQDDLPTMTLPACLQYNDSLGNPVTTLRLDLFATLISQQVCTNLASIQVINTTLTSYSSRLDILEACVLPCSSAVVEKQVVPTCIMNVGVLTDVSVLLLALEVRFCALETAVGLPAAINLAIGQTTIASSTLSLSGNKAAYGALDGWNGSVTNLAQSIQNSWVVMDDLYAAIAQIQTTCCPSGCEAITYAYTTTNILASSGLITSLNFNFQGSTIPNGFNDASGFSIIRATDVAGVIAQSTVSVSALQNNVAGIDLSVATLNTAQALSVQVHFGFTNGVDTCDNIVSSSVKGIVPCPSVITINAITSTLATVSFSQLLGSTAVYLIEILDPNNVVVGTYTQNNPTSSVLHNFTGLTPNTAYNVRVTTTFGGASEICTLVAFSTLTSSVACSTGMDVAFIVDYTSTNSTNVAALQNDVTSMVNQINSSSGSNVYRMALVTSDQTTATTPAYNSCTDYTNLPAAQRLNLVGSTGSYQVATAWEMFQNDNGATFTSQLAKLRGQVDGTCVNMGVGIGITNSPTDYTSSLVTGGSVLAGAFRSGVAKFVIITTDRLPGGTSQAFDQTTWSGIQHTIATGNTLGIKYIVVGAGVDLSGTISGTVIYPWRELATQTSGGYFNVVNGSQINNLIVTSCS